MSTQAIIDSYIQELRNEEMLLFESFLKNSNIEPSEKLMNEVYLMVKSSDYYHLLIDRTLKTEEGPVFPYYELKPEGLKALSKFPTLQAYIEHKEKEAKETNRIFGDNSIVGSTITGSTINQSKSFGDLENAVNVSQTPAQKAPEKKTIWSNIPEWAKILGGLGAIAGLIKVIIELTKP